MIGGYMFGAATSDDTRMEPLRSELDAYVSERLVAGT
jgi:hypothetical protein